VSAAARRGLPTIREFERWLTRNTGLSRTAANTEFATGFAAFAGEGEGQGRDARLSWRGTSLAESWFDVGMVWGRIEPLSTSQKDFGTIRGPFQITAPVHGGNHDAEVTFEIALESASQALQGEGWWRGNRLRSHFIPTRCNRGRGRRY